MSAARWRRCYGPVKRAADVVGALVLLVLTAPVQVAVAVLVAHQLGRPVLFRQRRAGRQGEPFTLYKFRSMRAPDPAAGVEDDADRLGPFGVWLRSSSLDEMPALWNVLRGDLSLVGPRPLLLDYLDRYTPEQGRRHEIRPGITGLAQTRGRNALGWEERLAYDVEYVDRYGPRLDLAVLLATARTVLTREGVSAPGAATMPEFMGTSQGDRHVGTAASRSR